MEDKNLICVCNHRKETHIYLPYSAVECLGCLDKLSVLGFATNNNVYHNFKLDNLKYLEELYSKCEQQRSDSSNISYLKRKE